MAANANGDYKDPFAFVPIANLAPAANVRITAEIAVAAGYAPADNHEIELILGCKTSAAYHRWIECLHNIQGSTDMLSLDGDFVDGTFTNMPGGTGSLSSPPQDGDLFIAEWYRSAQRMRWGRRRGAVTTWAHDLTDGSGTYINGTLGNGIGLAAFRRPGDTVSASFGLYNMLIEAF